jgi:phage shock protein PspC (stress-responsive transcriptional regulator)
VLPSASTVGVVVQVVGDDRDEWGSSLMDRDASPERMGDMSSVWSIRRSAADKKLAGVCGGVARHWNVDPVLVRVGWALLALSGGVGVVLYAAAWLLVPADGATSSSMDDLTKGATRGWPREAWVAIVAIACLITFGIFSSTTTIGFGPAVVLALIWYFGYYKTQVKKSAPPPSALTGQPMTPTPPPAAEPFRYPGPPTPFTEAAEAWRQRVEDMRGSYGTSSSAPAASTSAAFSAPTAPPTSAPSWSPSPTPPAQDAPAPGTQAPGGSGPAWQTYPVTAGPSTVQDPVSPEVLAAAHHADFLATADPVGLYTEEAPRQAAAAPSRRTQAHSLSARRLRLASVVVLGLVLLGLAIADALGVPITPLIYAAAALLVVGLTLIAATWLGRARGILPVGLLLLVAVLGLSVAVPASHFVHQVGYTSVAQLPVEPVTVDRGVLRVDLSGLDVTKDATFAADLGTGAVQILAPPNTNLVLDYSVGNGVVLDNDKTVVSGENLHGSSPLNRSVASEPTLTLHVELDQGVVAVKR